MAPVSRLWSSRRSCTTLLDRTRTRGSRSPPSSHSDRHHAQRGGTMAPGGLVQWINGGRPTGRRLPRRAAGRRTRDTMMTEQTRTGSVVLQVARTSPSDASLSGRPEEITRGTEVTAKLSHARQVGPQPPGKTQNQPAFPLSRHGEVDERDRVQGTRVRLLWAIAAAGHLTSSADE
jgi:hypothetical protein